MKWFGKGSQAQCVQSFDVREERKSVQILFIVFGHKIVICMLDSLIFHMLCCMPLMYAIWNWY